MKIQIENQRRLILFLAGAGVILAGIIFGIFQMFRYSGNTKTWSDELKTASRDGEKKEMKLLVQIAPPPADADPNDPSMSQRGDILAAYPADKEFSDAEKQGFLIIKVKSTEKFASLAVKPVQEIKEIEGVKGDKKPHTKTVRAHRFAVRLADIGIADDDFSGRAIGDKVYDDGIVYEKK